MKTRAFILTILGAVGLAGPAWAQAADVFPPLRREATMKLAGELLAPRDFSVKPENAVSPFAPPAFDQPDPEELRAQREAAAAAAAAGVVAKPTSDRGVLEKLAELIVPSGIVRLGGREILLFGQKKLKVGDRLTITFEGSDYDLDITAIGANTFTLRYNREEITRSIKPGKQP
ncbi:MAG: hypothetical protein H7A44_04515 [Opitutaceae bacterium]|jgi:ribosomal 50S subunit-recycling heat shock protein|nr:hypothetical protein [Cephaloticoccus sp.]MCP5529685.1 hypothetical protein [Opitutaceae bacterium]